MDQVKCPSGECINKSSYCDGVKHCADGSDEPPGCRNSCLAYLRFSYPRKICDGVRNCFDKSDENWETCRSKICTLKDAFVCKRWEWDCSIFHCRVLRDFLMQTFNEGKLKMSEEKTHLDCMMCLFLLFITTFLFYLANSQNINFVYCLGVCVNTRNIPHIVLLWICK